MKRALIPSLFTLLALTACGTTVGPDEAWFTYRNRQNTFAIMNIDGAPAGPRLRPGDQGAYPLSITRPHTVTISRATHKQLLGRDDDFHEVLVTDSVDPPFTIHWDEQSGTWAITPVAPANEH